jgi:hypothetical protein
LPSPKPSPFWPPSLLGVYKTAGSLLKSCEIYSLAENDSVCGHLPRIIEVHLTQHIDRIEHALGKRSGMESEHIEELKRVALQGGAALTDAVQEVEVLRLSKFLRF